MMTSLFSIRFVKCKLENSDVDGSDFLITY